MRGSIRSRSKNSWEIQIYTGKGPEGKPRRHVETVHGRKGDAQRRLTELLTSLDKGVYIPTGRLTVAEHLHQWLDGYVKTNCSPRTLDGYTSIVETHLIPALGNTQLKSLRAQAIDKYYGKARETLSARTVHHQHRVLSESLKYAVRLGYLGRNPCEDIKLRLPSKTTMRWMTSDEVEALLDVADSSQYYPVIYTAVSTGLRQAELLGLRWRDLDLDMLSISVCQVLYKRRGVSEFKTPKTDRSSRRVAMTPKLAIFLRDYKLEREAIYRKIGKEFTLDSLVFTNIDIGKVISPNVLSHAFKVIAEEAGLKDVHFHTLRHTFASLMLQQGAKPKVISEALGHSSVAFTMDTYSHIIEGMQEEAMSLLNEVLPVGKITASQKINGNLTAFPDIMSHKN